MRILALLAVVAAGLTTTLALADQSAPDPDARDGYAVFTRAARSGDVLPPAVREQLAPIVGKDVDLDAARAVAPAGRGYVWAIGGPQRLCLAVPDPVDGFGVACRDGSKVAAGDLWVGLQGGAGIPAGVVRMAILVPDATDAVTAVGGKRRQSLEVSDNVVFADAEGPDRFELADGGSVRSVDVPSADVPEGG
jgi:hypothetical protein